MKKKLTAIALTCLLAIGSAVGAYAFATSGEIKAAAQARSLSIGAYYMPKVSDASVRSMKEMGLDYMVVDGWSSINVRDENGRYVYENGKNKTESAALNSDFLGETLELFEKYGLKAVINLDNGTKTAPSELTDLSALTVDYTRYPAVTGFEIIDEPSLSQFDWIARVQDDFNASKYKDDYYFYVNLLNNRAAASVTGTSDYNEYVNTYTEKILSRMKQDKRQLIYDHYPLFQNDATGEFSFSPDYYRNIEILANKAVEQKAQFEGYIQTLSYNSHRAVTKADLSLQMYAHLAYGASGMRYFTFKAPPANGWFTEDTISAVTDQDWITDVYFDIKEVNEEVRTFDEVMLSYDWKGMLTSNGSASSEGVSFDTLTASLTSHRGIASLTSQYHMLAGVFEKGDDNAYMLVNAEDPLDGYKNIAELTFTGATRADVYRKGAKTTVTLENGKLKLRLDEGEGVFVVPQR